MGFVRNNSKQEDLLEYTNKCCTKYCKVDNEVPEWTIENEPLCDCPISYFYYAMAKLAAWEQGIELR
ncbi:hypothetical protein AB8U03_16675 [Clostridium sp. Mt-5]|uniref:Uncharacterized protein n=1 Tax=Clostridium moutaii TaxID=3240932 RepID=A0ABV4BUS5_9CLOT